MVSGGHLPIVALVAYAAGAIALSTLTTAFTERVRSSSQAPTPATPSSDLRTEPPAVVCRLLKVEATTLTAIEATIVDLARQGVVELVELRHGHDGARLKCDRPTGLRDFEFVVVDRLRMARGGSEGVPVAKFFNSWDRHGFAGVLTDNPTVDDLMDGWDARHGNLPSVLLVALGAIGITLAGARPFAAFVLSLAGLVIGWMVAAVLLRNRAYDLSDAGEEAARQWLAVREYIASDPELCNASARSVAIWGPYYAYAVALRVARPALLVLPPSTEPARSI